MSKLFNGCVFIPAGTETIHSHVWHLVFWHLLVSLLYGGLKVDFV